MIPAVPAIQTPVFGFPSRSSDVDPLLATPTTDHFPDDVHPDATALEAMATVQRSVIQ